MSKLIYQVDQVQIDPSRITTDLDPIFGSMTVFHDVVIASEIVQQYDDGLAFKSADELEASYWTWEGRWVTVGGHPDTPVVMDRDQIGGRTVNLRFKKDLKDHKTGRPMRRGNVADLQIFDDKVSAEDLEDMKNGKKSHVSIGFFFERDETPDTVQDGICKGESYDYVQRKIFGDHTAAGIDNGRCPPPYCGLGADQIHKLVATDPFAGFKNWGDCIAQMTKSKKEGGQGYTEEQAKKVCGMLQAKSEKKKKDEDALKNAAQILAQAMLDEIEDLKGMKDAKKEEKDPEWWRMLDWNEVGQELFDALPEETRQKIEDEGLCPDCSEKIVGEDLSLEEIDDKLKELKKQRDDLREQVRALEDKLYTEPPVEKKRKRDLREQINQLWDAMSDLHDEIQAFTEAKSIKITQSALTDEDELNTWTDTWILENVGEDAVLSSKQKRALPDSAYAYIEPGCKKEDGKTEQKCRHFIISDPAHVRAALAALKGARTGKIPAFADKAKPKICGAAKKFKIASEVCGTKKKKKDEVQEDEVLDPIAELERAQKVLDQLNRK